MTGTFVDDTVDQEKWNWDCTPDPASSAAGGISTSVTLATALAMAYLA